MEDGGRLKRQNVLKEVMSLQPTFQQVDLPSSRQQRQEAPVAPFMKTTSSVKTLALASIHVQGLQTK